MIELTTCPACDSPVLDEVTAEFTADVHDSSELIYLAWLNKDYRVARALRCRECAAVTVIYEESRR